jgi:hypothetical protein
LYLNVPPFLKTGEASIIVLLNKLSMPLLSISSLSIYMIHRFELLMVFQMSCMFHSCSFSIFSIAFD